MLSIKCPRAGQGVFDRPQITRKFCIVPRPLGWGSMKCPPSMRNVLCHLYLSSCWSDSFQFRNVLIKINYPKDAFLIFGVTSFPEQICNMIGRMVFDHYLKNGSKNNFHIPNIASSWIFPELISIPIRLTYVSSCNGNI